MNKIIFPISLMATVYHERRSIKKKKKSQKTTISKEKRMKKLNFSINVICKENRGEAVSQRLLSLLGIVPRIFF